MRLEMEFQKLKFLKVSNDSLEWDYNPFEERSTVKVVERKENANSAYNTNTFDYLSRDLLNYKELDNVVKLLRTEKMDSIEVFVLELTNKNLKEKHLVYYMNTKTFLLYKVEEKDGYRYFADYINHNGFIFPRFIIESKPNETFEAHFEKLEINTPLDDTLFIIPEEVIEKQRKAELRNDELLNEADSLYRSGKFDESIALFTKHINTVGETYGALNGRGLVKISKKEYYAAIGDFNKALELNPKGIGAQNNIGLAKYYLGDNEGAVKDYTKALEIDSTYTVSIKNRGLTYINLERYDEASRDFKIVIRLKPDDGESYFKYAVAQAQLKNYEMALTNYGHALKNKYNTAELYNYKGVTEYRLEKYDSARCSFGSAVGKDPDNLQYLENYGRAFYELGQNENAIEQFEKYLQKKNDQAEIHNLIGLCRYNDENYKGAIANFSKSIELDNDNPTFYDNRAAAKEMIEDYDGAIKDYSESIRLYPNDAAVFYKRGLIKLHTSKKIEGCLDLATANEMNYEPAKEAIISNCN